MVTPACKHDSQELEALLEKQDMGQPLYGDSAYVGQQAIIDECEMTNEVHEKGTKGHQKASNRVKSKSRARVEHVFGFMTNSMKAMYVRTIGSVRAVAKIGLTNLTLQPDALHAAQQKSAQRLSLGITTPCRG